VVYQGVDEGDGLPERSDNSILQRISITSNKAAATTKSDQITLVCCENASDFADVTTA